MPRKGKIATEEEVLQFFTAVMRRKDKDATKLSDAISAADKLYRHFREVKDVSDTDRECGVVILPQINDSTEKEEGIL